jgi:glycosyltransferase involved in cell wall biosynthesis
MRATVVITTKNRREDLLVAVRSALNQTAAPEVLVVDDGSTDGTADLIRSEFPTVRVDHHDVSKGYIVQRNHGAELARGDVIFSIDDDAEFSSPNVIGQTLAEFDRPRVGAVAIPFKDVNKDNVLNQQAPTADAVWCTATYTGTAHAIRRDVFRAAGGYRAELVHQGEETDLCVRLLDAGYVVRLGRADPIHHYESPKRDLRRMDLYGRRNDVLYAWYNVPMPAFPMQLLGSTWLGAKFGFKIGRPRRMLHGLFNGYVAMIREFGNRKPVSMSTYRINRRLRSAAIRLDDLEPELPPMRFEQ